MEMKDILTLANAGFTKEQIVALAKIDTQKETKVEKHEPIETKIDKTEKPQLENKIMEELAKLTGVIQANAILNTKQPEKESVEDILGEIINPTSLIKEDR